MTENQKLKMEILKEFAISDEPQSIETCRRAYQFLTEGETNTNPTTPQPASKKMADGVYYLTDDGTVVPYNAVLTPPEDTKGVLVVQGERSIVVALLESPAGEETTLTTRKDPEDCKGNYITSYEDAVADWNGQQNTEHLKAVGLSSNISLSDGWYIPSMGEMLFIFTHKKAINEALRKADAQVIADDWYWTSTEYSATNAWFLHLGTGRMYFGTRASHTYRVRPVSAFIS